MSDIDHIRRAVEVAGSQRKLAIASGLSQQLISKLLDGSRRVTPTNALAISRGTGGRVPLSDLVPDFAQALAAEQTGAAA